MDCPSGLEITLSQWGQEIVGHLDGHRHPLACTLEMTERCNLACVHCYIRLPVGSAEAAGREMSLPRLKAVLDKAADAGCLTVTLTGGETLLRPDFAEIYLHAKRTGMLVNLFTNGTLMSPRMADLLAEYRPWGIEITLYGHTHKTYEAVTQVPGSFERCRAGIDLLIERDLPLRLKCTVLTTNRHELPAMAAYAREMGVPFRWDALLWPRLDGSTQPLDYRLSPEKMLELDLADPDRSREWLRLAVLPGNGDARSERVFGCGAGQRSFHVDAAGRMSVCATARRRSYDLLHGSFEEGWHLLGKVISQKRRLAAACTSCSAGALCDQCPGWSNVTHGDDETPDEFICRLGHLRMAQWRTPDQ